MYIVTKALMFLVWLFLIIGVALTFSYVVTSVTGWWVPGVVLLLMLLLIAVVGVGTIFLD